MLREVKELRQDDCKLVRLLPLGADMKRSEFRIICDCQRHAARERTLVRRTARAFRRSVKRHAVTLAIGIPLTVGALALPSEAMNISLLGLKDVQPILTPRKIGSLFFAPTPPPPPTLETTKADFFRREVPYGDIIYREAKRNDLQPEFVAAVIEAESDFRPQLVSNKSAQGLMQIVPETSRLLGCDNPFNPEQNIAAGTKYLHYLLDRFGDQSVALAAYNAGEGNIERFGGIPPFGETHDYLGRVAQHTREYRQKIRSRFLAAARIHGANE